MLDAVESESPQCTFDWENHLLAPRVKQAIDIANKISASECSITLSKHSRYSPISSVNAGSHDFASGRCFGRVLRQSREAGQRLAEHRPQLGSRDSRRDPALLAAVIVLDADDVVL
ncbi:MULTISPECIES: hypothetical protein, partial [unclassified Bradyrhizobium]|uniref:hypothetical protein n=1 Tax=unclassified Bradyrhizobium TaxID=2631580 RepID=UPI0028E287B7